MTSAPIYLSMALAVLVAACQVKHEEANSQTKTIFGADDRVEMTSSEMPWSAIGKVRSDLGHCTGNLVGPDLVLTNAHCVFNPDKTIASNIEFLPNFKNGQGTYSSYANHVWWGTKDPDAERHLDWAIIRLSSRLGDQFGFFGTRLLDFSNTAPMAGWFTLAGYSSDFRNGDTAGVHQNCSIKAVRYDYLMHDCDMEKGASGSGIFAKWNDGGQQIVALNAAQVLNNDGTRQAPGTTYSDDRGNIAVKADKFADMITKLRSSNEGQKTTTQVHLCNKSGKGDIFAALAYFKDTWNTKGWWKITDGTCKEVSVSENYKGDIFLYAKSADNTTTWGNGDYNFCVNPSDAFDIKAADVSCDATQGLTKVNFSKAFTISIDRLNTWNFNP